MKKLYFILPIFLLFISCSEDRITEENKQVVNTNVRVINDDDPPAGQGDIPRSKLVYKSMAVSEFPLQELCERYKKDIEVTAPDYHDNLKNFWFSLICDRVINEGSDEMKIYFLKEQISLKNNILNLKRFYGVLLSCSLSNEECENIAAEFSKKNKDFINNKVNWKDDKDRKSKLSELIYTQRTFGLLMLNKR